MKKQLLSIIAASLMLGGVSQMKAMDAALMLTAQATTSMVIHTQRAAKPMQVATQSDDLKEQALSKLKDEANNILHNDQSVGFITRMEKNPQGIIGFAVMQLTPQNNIDIFGQRTYKRIEIGFHPLTEPTRNEEWASYRKRVKKQRRNLTYEYMTSVFETPEESINAL